MFKRLFLGTTNVDFQKLGSRFYKIFIIEFVLFTTIILSSLFGIFTLNLSVDFTGGTTINYQQHILIMILMMFLTMTYYKYQDIKHLKIPIQ